MLVYILIGVLIVFMLFIWNGAISKKQANDQSLADALDEALQKLLSKRSSVWPSVVQEYKGLRLGEVARHFDSNTSATISGWLTHDLGFHGWGVGASVGALGLGMGKLGLSGTSQVNLTSEGTTRDNMMGDGFIAVFEHDTNAGVDTIRLVVLSENATQQLGAAILDQLLNRLTTVNNDGVRSINWPRCHATLKGRSPELLSFQNEASYISDRLHAVLRMPAESRPLVTFYGEPLSGHAVLGTAIQIAGDDMIYPLFPIALFRELSLLIEKLIVTLNRTGS